MTSNTYIAATLAGALALTALTVSARGQEAATGPATETRSADADRAGDARFALLDSDGDGQVTAEDLAARAQARFAAADTDGNGVLSAAELVAAAEARRMNLTRARVERRIARRDLDGDGALSAAEMTAGRDGSRMLGRLDADNDGAISREEFAEARERRREARGDHRHSDSDGGKRARRGIERDGSVAGRD